MFETLSLRRARQRNDVWSLSIVSMTTAEPPTQQQFSSEDRQAVANSHSQEADAEAEHNAARDATELHTVESRTLHQRSDVNAPAKAKPESLESLKRFWKRHVSITVPQTKARDFLGTLSICSIPLERFNAPRSNSFISQYLSISQLLNGPILRTFIRR